MSASRPIRLPADDFDQRGLPASVVKNLAGLRVHSSRFPAISFRLNPYHRFSHPQMPCGLLYMGEDLVTCLWECFGDEILNQSMIARVDWGKKLSEVSATGPLEICDLTDLATRRALGLDLSALKHTELAVPQAWGLAIRNHPDAVDGLRYPSRFTGEPCLVLFERPKMVSKLRENLISSLAELDSADDFLDANAVVLV